MAKQKSDSSSSVGSFLRRQKKTILLIVIVAGLTLAVSAVVSMLLNGSFPVSFPGVGHIETVGVRAYWDSSLTNQTTRIDWGTVYTGSSRNVTLYLQNAGNVPATLHLEATNWTYMDSGNHVVNGPSNTTRYMSLTWNYGNQTVNPSQSLQVTLTLTTDGSVNFTTFLTDYDVNQFSMDIIVGATGT